MMKKFREIGITERRWREVEEGGGQNNCSDPQWTCLSVGVLWAFGKHQICTLTVVKMWSWSIKAAAKSSDVLVLCCWLVGNQKFCVLVRWAAWRCRKAGAHTPMGVCVVGVVSGL